MFSPDLILETLKSARRHLERGKITTCTLFDKDLFCLNSMRVEEPNPLMIGQLPGDAIQSLEGYLQSLQAQDRFSEFALYLDSPHQLQVGIWNVFRRLLAELQNHGIEPQQQVSSDIFIGNYSQTPFGIHKDPLHNLMFVSQGKRVMHFWRDVEGQPGHVDQESQLSLEAEPGDLVYWPPGAWHVGANPDGRAVSINLDIWETTGAPWTQTAMADALANAAAPIISLRTPRRLQQSVTDTIPGTASLQQASGEVLANLSANVLELQLTKKLAQRLSCAGLNCPIPVTEARSTSDSSAYQSSDAPLVIIPCQGKLLIACNGHVTVQSDNPAWRAILDKVESGTVFTPVELISLAPVTAQDRVLAWIGDMLACQGIVESGPRRDTHAG